MKISKKIKLIIFIFFISIFATDFCLAQEAQQVQELQEPQKAQVQEVQTQETQEAQMPEKTGSEKPPYKNIKEYEPPKEFEKEPPPSNIDKINPDKPNICGSITFDKTIKPTPISIKKALEIALDNNFNIKIFIQKKEASRWLYYNSGTKLLPDITYSHLLRKNVGDFVIGGVLSDDVEETILESNGLFEYVINMSKFFNIMVAKNQYKSQKKQLNFTIAQVLRDTTTQYYELLGYKKGIEILETNLEQIKEQLRINKEKLEAGVGTKFDVLRAEADKARAEQSLIVARNTYRFNQARLANTMGIPVLVELVPDDKDIRVETVFKKCFDLEQAKNIALKNRDDLKSAHFNVLTAKNKRNAAYSIYMPQVILRAQKAKQGTLGIYIGSNQFTSEGVLYEGGRGLGLTGLTDIKSLSAQLKESELTYDNLSRKIEEDIVAAFVQVVADKGLIDASWKELQAASESRNISVIRLKEGIGTFIDVLQTQNTYTTAYINYIRAVLGYNVSQSKLLFEMGVITANNILDGYDYETFSKGKDD